jgi:hypothetical protein
MESISEACPGLLLLANWLNVKTLEDWLSNYPTAERNKTIAVIMAGNIPLV